MKTGKKNVDFKQIKWRSGNGSIMMGTTTIFLAFVAIVVIIEIFNIQFTHTRTQMLTDTIADGGAVAGNTVGGFDEAEMEEVARELIKKNGVEGHFDYDINATPETDALGNPTGNTVVDVKIKADREPIMRDYFDIIGGFTVETYAEVWVGQQNEGGGWIEDSFAVVPSSPPFATTAPGYRSGAYVTWFINYYLCPVSNPVYSVNINNTAFFLNDYLVCMGFADAYQSRSLDEWYSLFSSLPDGWERTNSVTEAQANANSGKPVIAFFTNDHGVKDVCLIVPAQGVIESNQIATAHVGQSNWNYKKTDIRSFFDIVFYVHE